MQTHFTVEQLKDPALARANAILRACVHCGLCTATCPTFQVLGDELDSPRGRIYLIKDMLEGGRDADEKTVMHLDRCLSCLSCMTTCPSGVNYMHLIDLARAHVEKTYRRPLRDRLLREALATILPSPARFRLALFAARLARPFAALVPDRRLRAMLSLVPTAKLGSGQGLCAGIYPACGTRRMRIALLPGCVQQVLAPHIDEAAVRLLQRFGVEVVIPKGAGCCGALVHHLGKTASAQPQAAAVIKALIAEKRAGGLDAVTITASGCGTVVKDYGHLFAQDPALAEQAKEVAGLAKDISEILAGLALKGAAPEPLRVAYHAACSLQHGQKLRDMPKKLLAGVGFTVVEPKNAHLCCGSAGTYALLQPEISEELKQRKVAALHAIKPDLIATGNIGCLTQIGSATNVPIVHSVELLDWATGGPKPYALRTLGGRNPVAERTA